MADVEYTGWGSRLGKAIIGIPVGIALFLGSFGLLFWNEGRAVKRAEDLEFGAKNVVSVSDTGKVDPANDGKLVHMSGEATTAETLKDNTFGVEAKALKLTRKVEIYQWKERTEKKTEKKVGGREETTTYHYHDKVWSDKPIDSGGFGKDDATGEFYTNVGTKTWPDDTLRPKEATLGAYKLTASQVDRLGEGEKLPVSSASLESVPDDLRGDLKVNSEGDFYKPFKPNGDPGVPEIGDQRVSYLVVKPQPVSLIARQNKDTFEPYPTKTGNTLDEFRPGTMSADAMIAQAAAENETTTWVLRLVGVVVMAVGIFLVLQPFATFADVLPFLGNLASAAIAVFALVVALPLSLITIALGWVFYRPLVGIPLLVVGVGILAGTFFLVRKARAGKVAEKKRESHRSDDDMDDYEDRPRKQKRDEDD